MTHSDSNEVSENEQVNRTMTIDKLRDALRWYETQEALVAYNYFKKYGEYPFETFYKATQAALEFIETDEAGKRLLQMIEGGE
jgi:hypothetical protein